MNTIEIARADDWSSWKPYFDQLESEELSVENLPAWLEKWSDLEGHLREESLKAGRARDENTADKTAEETYKRFLSDIRPKASVAGQALRAKLLAVQNYEPAPDEVDLLLRMRSDSELFRDKNVPLQAETSVLASEYNKMVGGLTVEWEGRDQTLAEASLSLQSDDRAIREACFRAIMDKFLEIDYALDNLYLELIPKRRQIAKNAGFDSYRDYVWREKYRFDYTPADGKAFRDAIQKVWVPLAANVLERRKAALGVDLLRPWDLEVDPSGKPPLRPFRDIDDLIERTTSVMMNVSPDFGEDFKRMIPDFVDLGARPNKSPGGYMAFLPVTGVPYIFMNAAGSRGDVKTLLHEAGHAIHYFQASQNQRLSWNIGAPMEFSEVGSMAMELLAHPYLERDKGGYYTHEEAIRDKHDHLEKIVLFMPYMAVVNGFQEWVYTEAPENVTAAEIDSKWDELWGKFMTVTDWNGIETERATGWHRKQHIFNSPFYYIEYGIAQLGALQVYKNALADQPTAVAQYKAACQLGRTASLTELFHVAGARLPFDEGLLSDIAEFVRGLLEA